MPGSALPIRFVLVGTSHPGNIGAAARAMKTMGLHDLHLVAPRRFPDAEATARASGADDLLAAAPVHDRLSTALAGCRFVVGASARRRTIEWPELDPRACAERLLAEAAQGPVALVFGREASGLSNPELDRCQALTRVDTNPDFGSLNLAAAVQIYAYELRTRIRAGAWSPGEDRPVADPPMLDGFHAHLAATLEQIGFVKPGQHRTLLRRLRRLFDRARPDPDEINILRGILSRVQRCCR